MKLALVFLRELFQNGRKSSAGAAPVRVKVHNSREIARVLSLLLSFIIEYFRFERLLVENFHKMTPSMTLIYYYIVICQGVTYI